MLQTVSANPFAAYDALAILADVGDRNNALAEAEVHLFAYLACLLSLFSGAPAADWGYSFVSADSGSPFSKQLSETIEILTTTGHIVQSDGLLLITEGGRLFREATRSLNQNAPRNGPLDAAASSVLTMSFGQLRLAIMQEPGLHSASALGRADWLMSEPMLHALHEEFSRLSKIIGPAIDDLWVPAVVWLTFLSEVHKQRYKTDLSTSA